MSPFLPFFLLQGSPYTSSNLCKFIYTGASQWALFFAMFVPKIFTLVQFCWKPRGIPCARSRHPRAMARNSFTNLLTSSTAWTDEGQKKYIAPISQKLIFDYMWSILFLGNILQRILLDNMSNHTMIIAQGTRGVAWEDMVVLERTSQVLRSWEDPCAGYAPLQKNVRKKVTLLITWMGRLMVVWS